MVQVLPSRTDVGASIGAGLGQGLGQGIARGADIGFQRNVLQDAMQGLQNARTPIEQAQKLAQIAQISPHAASLLQPLLQSQFRSTVYNQGQGQVYPSQPQGLGQNQQPGAMGFAGQSQQQSPVVAPDNSQISQRAGNPPIQQPQGQRFPENLGIPSANLTPGMEQQGPAQERGLVSHIRTPEEQEARIGQLESQYLMPHEQAVKYVTEEQERAQLARTGAEAKARQVLGIGSTDDGKPIAGSLATESDIPEIMLLGQQLSHITDPDRWARALKDSWLNYKDTKTQLAKAFVPGFWQKMLMSKGSQQEALKRLEPISQKYVKMGMEQELRKQLLDQDLSETQIEAQIHPWTDKNKTQLNSLRNGIFTPNVHDEVSRGAGIGAFAGAGAGGLIGAPISAALGALTGGLIGKGVEKKQKPSPSYEQMLQKHPELIEKQNTQLANWMKKNVDQNMSLNVLRQHLWKEKGYDWRQIAAALQEAQRGENPLQLTQRQGIEESTVATQPPIEDLSNILLGWDRSVRFLQQAE